MSESESDETEAELTLERPEQTLDTEWVPRDAIEPNDWNPNVIEDEERALLKKSIRNQGWTQPIVVHAQDLYIIDGEQRWTVAGDDDMQTDEDLTPEGVPAGYVPVFGITIDEDQAKVSTVQHNRARGFVEYEGLYDYFEEFQDDDLLDELTDELNMDDETVLRIADQQGVAEAVAEYGELSPPWEPVDVRDADAGPSDDDYSTATESLSDGSTDEDTERIEYVLSEDEREFVHAVLTDDDTAEVLLAYCRYMDDRGLIQDFRAVTGIEASDSEPHPDESEDE